MCQKLAKATKVTSDGTFDCCPDPFKQVLTVNYLRTKLGVTKLFTALYVVMTHKSEVCYRMFVRWLKDYLVQVSDTSIRWRSIMLDFEEALVNTYKSFFPNVRIGGCNFHFGQLVNRCLQANGLIVIASERDSTLNRLIRLIKAIGYLPVEEVQDAYNSEVLPYYEDMSDADEFRDLQEQVNIFKGSPTSNLPCISHSSLVNSALSASFS
jgi:hypothetical protein